MKVKNKFWGKYHIPSCPNYMKRPKNAIFISSSNSLEHEMLKLKVCYQFRKEGINYITEAVRNKLDSKGKSRKVDVVNINTGDEWEIEMTERRAKRFLGEEGVFVVKGWKVKG